MTRQRKILLLVAAAVLVLAGGVFTLVATREPRIVRCGHMTLATQDWQAKDEPSAAALVKEITSPAVRSEIAARARAIDPDWPYQRTDISIRAGHDGTYVWITWTFAHLTRETYKLKGWSLSRGFEYDDGPVTARNDAMKRAIRDVVDAHCRKLGAVEVEGL